MKLDLMNYWVDHSSQGESMSWGGAFTNGVPRLHYGPTSSYKTSVMLRKGTLSDF